jgi:hypothetical protein
MTTRREVLAAGGVLALAGLRPAAARAAGNNVVLLGVLVGYNDAVLSTYELALRNPDLPARDRALLRQLYNQAKLADAALRRTLARAGATPPPRHRPGAGTGDVKSVLAAEEATVGAYYLSLQSVPDRPLIAEISGLMSQAGRRLVQLRDLAGLAPLPSAFETGGR